MSSKGRNTAWTLKGREISRAVGSAEGALLYPEIGGVVNFFSASALSAAAVDKANTELKSLKTSLGPRKQSQQEDGKLAIPTALLSGQRIFFGEKITAIRFLRHR